MTDNFLKSMEQIIKEIDDIINEASENIYEKNLDEKYERNDPYEELEDYFTTQDDEEEGRFNDTPTEDLLNPDIPAPWEKI